MQIRDWISADAREPPSRSASGSGRLVAWHQRLLLDLKLAHLTARQFQSPGPEQSVPQHADIVLALAAGDASGAEAALQRHLIEAECLLLQGLTGGHGRADAGRHPAPAHQPAGMLALARDSPAHSHFHAAGFRFGTA